MNEVSNVVRWIGDVNVVIYEKIIEKIENLISCDALVTLIVTSEGGYMPVAVDFCEEVRIRSFEFNTLAIGRVASAAIPIFLTGKKRLMSFNAHFLFHLPDLTDGDERKNFNMRQWYIEKIVKSCSLTEKKVVQLAEEEILIDSEMAKDFGLVDEVI